MSAVKLQRATGADLARRLTAYVIADQTLLSERKPDMEEFSVRGHVKRKHLSPSSARDTADETPLTRSVAGYTRSAKATKSSSPR